MYFLFSFPDYLKEHSNGYHEMPSMKDKYTLLNMIFLGIEEENLSTLNTTIELKEKLPEDPLVEIENKYLKN